MKSGVNHKYTEVIKDISALHKNRLGQKNYSLLQSLLGLPGKTTAALHAGSDKIFLEINKHIFNKATALYEIKPVIDCNDEVRTLPISLRWQLKLPHM